MKIIRNFRNDLLRRNEIQVVIEAISNPGFEKVQNLVVEKFKAADEVLVVNSIKNRFGSHFFLIDASIYDSVKDKDMTEPKKKIKEVKQN